MNDELINTVYYDADSRRLVIDLGGHNVEIDGLAEQVGFERTSDGLGVAYALWLMPGQADVLVKMIGYILEKVRITESSAATLRDLLPHLQRIRAQGAPPPNGQERS